MDTDKAAEYARLRNLQKGADAEAKEFKAQADKIEMDLLDEMLAAGLDSLTVKGQLIYTTTRVAANKSPDADTSAYYAALREADLGDLIKPGVNAQSLAAWVREQEADGKSFPEDLPEALKGLMNVHHITSLGVKKAASRRAPAARA